MKPKNEGFGRRSYGRVTRMQWRLQTSRRSLLSFELWVKKYDLNGECLLKLGGVDIEGDATGWIDEMVKIARDKS